MAKGFPKSKKDGKPGVKKHEARARKFTTNCMWIFRSETSPRHRQKKTLTADETSQVTDRWHRKGGWPTAHCSAARRVLGDNGTMPSKARVKVFLPPSSASSQSHLIRRGRGAPRAPRGVRLGVGGSCATPIDKPVPAGLWGWAGPPPRGGYTGVHGTVMGQLSTEPCLAE